MTMLQVGISPSASEIRVLAMTGTNDTLLKARLSARPSHPRAIATLLEALALWEGEKVSAALVAGERAGVSDLRLYRDADLDEGALYRVAWVPAFLSDHQPRDAFGLDGFADLHALVRREAMR